MKNKPTANKTAINKPAKATKNRITALILALLLTVTVLIPQIPVKAEGTTTQSTGISENNGSGGTSAGAGDNLPIDTGDKLTITTNEDGTRTLRFTQRIKCVFKNNSYVSNDDYTYVVNGKGKFVIISYLDNTQPGNDNGLRISSFVLSNESFTNKYIISNGLLKDNSVYFYNGVYYSYANNLSNDNPLSSVELTNFPNLSHVTLNDGDTFINVLKRLIDSGDLDLSKDDYISDEDKADMTPVRDESIGYLPRVRYFDNRKSSSTLRETTSTIQWASFEEPYASDLDNPYYVEVYASLCLKLSGTDTLIEVGHQYKKYGELKYVAERIEFPYTNPFYSYLDSSDLEYREMIFPQTHIVCFYVRLVHYDYDKQQVLCGGWTKLTPNDNGGCTSETGDSPTDDPDDFVPDDDPKEWGDDGWKPDPTPDDPTPKPPEDPDFTIDDTNIFTLIYSLVKITNSFIVGVINQFLYAFKSLFYSVGEFPDLCKHVFSFLPDETNNLLFGGLAAIIVMRFLGR